MTELHINRTALLTPLLLVSGAVDKRQSLVILSHILFHLEQDEEMLTMTATDLEMEISAKIPCDSVGESGRFTVPAKKFIEIIRSLEEQACPIIKHQGSAILVKADRSQFKLATLPQEDFPNASAEPLEVEFSIPRLEFLRLLQMTFFAMSVQQDVRAFLNGLLLEISPSAITAVSMDGHRMAICKFPYKSTVSLQRLLIPRKSVQEMLRVLTAVADETIQIGAGKSHFRLSTAGYSFSSKLIEAQFPPYHLAIPKDNDKFVVVEKEAIKRALSRIIILANEKVKAVQMQVEPGCLTLIATNEKQEEANEVVEAMVDGEPLNIGINAAYLLEVLGYISDTTVRLSLSTGDKSVLVEPLQDENYLYIIMPMKL